MDLTVTGKTRVIPPTAAIFYGGVGGAPGIPGYADRYKWLSLELAEPNLGIPLSGIDIGSLLTGSYLFSSTQTFLLCSNQRGERGWVAFNAAEQQFNSEERPDLTNVDMGLEWVLYRDPIIINFQLSAQYFGNFTFYPGIIGGETPTIPILLEAGTDPNALGTGVVTLSWVTNKIDQRAIRTFYLKTPNNQINDTRLNLLTGAFNFRTYTLPKIDTTTQGTSTFYLTAQDWRGDRATAELVIRALGPIYFGYTSKANSDINETDIEVGSDKIITGSPQTTYFFSNPAGRRLFMAWPRDLSYVPSRFFMNGSPLSIAITNNDIIDNLPVTMDSGAIINYRVFVTQNSYNAANTTVRLQ